MARTVEYKVRVVVRGLRKRVAALVMARRGWQRAAHHCRTHIITPIVVIVRCLSSLRKTFNGSTADVPFAALHNEAMSHKVLPIDSSLLHTLKTTKTLATIEVRFAIKIDPFLASPAPEA